MRRAIGWPSRHIRPLWRTRRPRVPHSDGKDRGSGWPVCSRIHGTVGIRLAMTLARTLGTDHERAVGRFGTREIRHGGRDHRIAPSGFARPERFLPEGRAVLVVVAIAAFVEDHPPGGVEDEIGEPPRARYARAIVRGLLSIRLMVVKISPTASSPVESGISVSPERIDPGCVSQFHASTIHRLPADCLKKSQPAGRIVTTGSVDVV